MTAAAVCEIGGCGVLAVGRCSGCDRAFCQSHQLFVYEEHKQVDPAGPFTVSVSRSVNRYGVALCSECDATSKAAADAAELKRTADRDARRAAEESARTAIQAEFRDFMVPNYPLIVDRLFGLPKLVSERYVFCVRSKSGGQATEIRKSRLHFRRLRDVVHFYVPGENPVIGRRVPPSAFDLLADGTWAQTRLPNQPRDDYPDHPANVRVGYRYPDKRGDYYRGLIEDPSLPEPLSLDAGPGLIRMAWLRAQEHNLTGDFPEIPPDIYWS